MSTRSSRSPSSFERRWTYATRLRYAETELTPVIHQVSSVYASLCLSVCLSVSLSLSQRERERVSLCLSVGLYISPSSSFWLSQSLSVCRFLSVSVCLSFILSAYKQVGYCDLHTLWGVVDNVWLCLIYYYLTLYMRVSWSLPLCFCLYPSLSNPLYLSVIVSSYLSVCLSFGPFRCVYISVCLSLSFTLSLHHSLFVPLSISVFLSYYLSGQSESVYLFFHPFVCAQLCCSQSVSQPVNQPVSQFLSVCLACLLVDLSACKSVCLSECLSVCLSVCDI